MPEIVLQGSKSYRPAFLYRAALNRINHRIAKENLQHFPQLAIFAFDNIGLAINLEGRYESDCLEVLSQFLTERLRIDTNSTVLDIGANIGNHAVFFSRIFSKAYAFEPNPHVFRLLNLNSDGSNIVPLNYGLSNGNSTLAFEIDPTNLGASKVVTRDSMSQSRRSTTTIEVRRLDEDPLIRNENVSPLKVDVEGHELEVLEGGADLIETARPVIVFEQGPETISDGSSPVIDFLRDRNYRFFTIQSNFYLGRRYPARLLALFMRMLFGFRKNVVSTDRFDSRFYPMIIGVPGNVNYRSVS
ncbi:MAG: FkbM family methyltransferase [Actinomycetota bacterium]